MGSVGTVEGTAACATLLESSEGGDVWCALRHGHDGPHERAKRDKPVATKTQAPPTEKKRGLLARRAPNDMGSTKGPSGDRELIAKNDLEYRARAGEGPARHLEGLSERNTALVDGLKARFDAHAAAEGLDETGEALARATERLKAVSRDYAMAIRLGGPSNESHVLARLGVAAQAFDFAERAHANAQAPKPKGG